MKWDFAAQLARYGPDTSPASVARADAHSYCAWLARTHYENFTVASLLLPRRLLRHFHAVYAYCRWADDLADEAGDAQTALRLLGWWRGQLLDCYQGRAHHPVFVALEETVRAFRIPAQPFLDLLTAFEQDQHVQRYATFAQLLEYCKNSANPVGRLVLYLFEAHDEETARLSDHICTALQLANFWQDVASDLDLGRIYLPAEDRLRFGVGDEELLARQFTPPFARLLESLLERTREMFFQGYPLVDRVPRAYAGEVELFIEGGLAILARIEKCGYDVLSRRPTVPAWQKGLLVAGAVWRRLRGRLLAG